jgi:hypothetical protein
MPNLINVSISGTPTKEVSGLLFHGTNSVTQKDVDAFIVSIDIKTIGDKTTFVQATLKNGFTLEETSSCVSPENYDAELGADICLEKIKDRVWYLLGFLLQSALYGFRR